MKYTKNTKINIHNRILIGEHLLKEKSFQDKYNIYSKRLQEVFHPFFDKSSWLSKIKHSQNEKTISEMAWITLLILDHLERNGREHYCNISDNINTIITFIKNKKEYMFAILLAGALTMDTDDNHYKVVLKLWIGTHFGSTEEDLIFVINTIFNKHTNALLSPSVYALLLAGLDKEVNRDFFAYLYNLGFIEWQSANRTMRILDKALKGFKDYGYTKSLINRALIDFGKSCHNAEKPVFISSQFYDSAVSMIENKFISDEVDMDQVLFYVIKSKEFFVDYHKIKEEETKWEGTENYLRKGLVAAIYFINVFTEGTLTRRNITLSLSIAKTLENRYSEKLHEHYKISKEEISKIILDLEREFSDLSPTDQEIEAVKTLYDSGAKLNLAVQNAILENFKQWMDESCFLNETSPFNWGHHAQHMRFASYLMQLGTKSFAL